MTPTEVKQAADEMVEVFGPYMAIEHCKRVIEVLERLDSSRGIPMLIATINNHRLILSELE